MRLDIRTTFLAAALEQPQAVRRGIRKLVELASRLSFPELLAHEGIHLEKCKGLTTRDGRAQYTLRITRSARALAVLEGETLVLLYVEADHDQAYRN